MTKQTLLRPVFGLMALCSIATVLVLGPSATAHADDIGLKCPGGCAQRTPVVTDTTGTLPSGNRA
ncbi:hypothetical protein [Streptomyces sp. NPDC002564]|uniref:hypothetical protein n=1 Tax=Streptomyces sp. NPDC002564 TaxID=3364649 RepID=UPI0036CF978F